MLSEDEDAMALLRRMAEATERIAQKIPPPHDSDLPAWATGNCSEHREPQPLCVICNVLGAELTQSRALYVRATNERCRLEDELRALKKRELLACKSCGLAVHSLETHSDCPGIGWRVRLSELKTALQLAADILWDGTPAPEEFFKAAIRLGVKSRRAP